MSNLTIPVMWADPPEPPADADYEGYDDGFVPTEATQRIARLEAAARRAIKRIEQVQNAHCNSFLKDVVLSLEQALT